MQTITLTELRARAKHYFDVVEQGQALRIYRHGKPVADIIPIRTTVPLTIKGLALSKEILQDRQLST